jgi:hypothetical protein
LESIGREPGDVERVEEEQGNRRRYVAGAARERLPGNISIGNDGSCMIVDGL